MLNESPDSLEPTVADVFNSLEQSSQEAILEVMADPDDNVVERLSYEFYSDEKRLTRQHPNLAILSLLQSESAFDYNILMQEIVRLIEMMNENKAIIEAMRDVRLRYLFFPIRTGEHSASLSSESGSTHIKNVLRRILNGEITCPDFTSLLDEINAEYNRRAAELEDTDDF